MWMFSSARGFGNVQKHISRRVACLSFHPVFFVFQKFWWTHFSRVGRDRLISYSVHTRSFIGYNLYVCVCVYFWKEKNLLFVLCQSTDVSCSPRCFAVQPTGCLNLTWNSKLTFLFSSQETIDFLLWSSFICDHVCDRWLLVFFEFFESLATIMASITTTGLLLPIDKQR
jgi:hypothetical protein